METTFHSNPFGNPLYLSFLQLPLRELFVAFQTDKEASFLKKNPIFIKVYFETKYHVSIRQDKVHTAFERFQDLLEYDYSHTHLSFHNGPFISTRFVEFYLNQEITETIEEYFTGNSVMEAYTYLYTYFIFITKVVRDKLDNAAAFVKYKSFRSFAKFLKTEVFTNDFHEWIISMMRDGWNNEICMFFGKLLYVNSPIEYIDQFGVSSYSFDLDSLASLRFCLLDDNIMTDEFNTNLIDLISAFVGTLELRASPETFENTAA